MGNATESEHGEADNENESDYDSEWGHSESDYAWEREWGWVGRRIWESERQSREEPCLRWLELPRDVTLSILSRLGAAEIIERVQKVCTQWRGICKDPSMWKSIDMMNRRGLNAMPSDLDKMCRHAVDRSCGGLVDIDITYFGSDDLVAYIAQRTSHLRRLRLITCWFVSDEGLSKVAPKFPLLEELEIYCGHAGEGATAAVGRCCPLLKTLKYNQQGTREPFYINDKVALNIAENMPGLRNLQLIGNKLTNHGLQAILDGAPTLNPSTCAGVSLLI